MSELVEQVAKALEPLVDQRPAIDASASHIRSLQARALACAALSVLEPRIEQLERVLAEALAAERERCARVVETHDWARARLVKHSPLTSPASTALRSAAAAIRTGEAEQ